MSNINPPKVLGSESLDAAIEMLKDLKSKPKHMPKSIWKSELNNKDMQDHKNVITSIVGCVSSKSKEVKESILEYSIFIGLILWFVVAIAFWVFTIGAIFKLGLYIWRYL